MADVAAPVFKKRSNKNNNIRKRPATPPPEDSASDSDYTSDEGAARIKRRKKDGLNTAISSKQATQDLSKSTKYTADRSTTIATNDDATKTSNWYTGADVEAAKPASKAGAEESNGVYKGAASYGSFIQKHPDAEERKVGPMKAPTNVRTITVTDFAPDVCKD